MSEPLTAGGVPVQIVLRPYATALPMAGFAFGIGNILYSSLVLGWVPMTDSMTVAVMLLAFAAPLELFPSVLAFLSRDANGATAFGIFGASWVVQGLELLLAGGNKPSAVGGIFQLSLTLVLLILCGITFKGKPLLGALLIVAVLRTLAFALVNLGYKGLQSTGAILGLVVAAFAFYGAFAFLYEEMSETISPLTLRFGKAKEAMSGRLDQQVEPLSREIGIRKQL